MALNEGVINVDQFLSLNEHIGGMDIDGNLVPEREEATEEVIANAYTSGSVIGEGPLLDVPIILRNLYTDDIGDIHTRFHAFSIRDRLAQDGVDDPNLLLWTAPTGDLVAQLLGNVAGGNDPITLLDEWLTTGTKPERRDEPVSARRRDGAHRWLGAVRRTGPVRRRVPDLRRPATGRGQGATWRRGQVRAHRHRLRDVFRRVHGRAASALGVDLPRRRV